MEQAKIIAEEVAAEVVEAVDRNRLYVIPKRDAKIGRLIKRLAPASSTNLVGALCARSARRARPKSAEDAVGLSRGGFQ
jgi:hypothetical protein